MASSNPNAPDTPAAVPQVTGKRQKQDSIAAAQKRLRDRLLIALAGIAGYVDALSYVALGHIFVANITGAWVGLLAGVTRRLRTEAETSGERWPPHLASLYPQERDARLLLVYIVAAALCGVLTNLGVVGARVAVIPLTPALAVTAIIAARGFRAAAPRAGSHRHNQ